MLWFLLQIVQKKQSEYQNYEISEKNDVFDFLVLFYYTFWIGTRAGGKGNSAEDPTHWLLTSSIFLSLFTFFPLHFLQRSLGSTDSPSPWHS